MWSIQSYIISLVSLSAIPSIQRPFASLFFAVSYNVREYRFRECTSVGNCSAAEVRLDHADEMDPYFTDVALERFLKRFLPVKGKIPKLAPVEFPSDAENNETAFVCFFT